MRSGWIEFLLCHPHLVLVVLFIELLQLIYPALGYIVTLLSDVHHEAEEAIGALDPRPVADVKFGIVLLAVVLANAPMQ